MSKRTEYGEVRVPCPFGEIVATYQGDPGYYEGIEINLILPDGGEMQCALVEVDVSQNPPVMQMAMWNGDEESPVYSTTFNPEGEWVYR